MGMTPKQEAFAREYLIDLNATQAAIRAGYSRGTAKEQGCVLLTNPNVAQFVADGIAVRAAQTGIDARWVLEQAVEVYRAARDDDKLSEALRALEHIGKHVDVGAFRERIEHTGKDGGAIQLEQVTNDADAFTRSIAGIAARTGAASGDSQTQH